MQPLRRFVVAVMTAAVLPRLAHRGMFVDGVTYASIARNLAEGRGTFWEPSYTATIYPRFFEHPPLGFWLQSLWFRVFGDHLFVERAYAAVAALVTAALIALIWRTLNATTSEKNYGWLPVLLWIAVPIVSWAVVGNLLEVTVSVFTILAVACVVFAALSTSTAAAVGWGIASGLAVIGAFLTKGPVGLFPLAAPVLLAAIPASRPGSAYRRPAVTLAGQWAVAALGIAVLLSMPLARSSLGQYLEPAGGCRVIWRARSERQLVHHPKDASAGGPAADDACDACGVGCGAHVGPSVEQAAHTSVVVLAPRTGGDPAHRRQPETSRALPGACSAVLCPRRRQPARRHIESGDRANRSSPSFESCRCSHAGPPGGRHRRRRLAPNRPRSPANRRD